MILAGLGPMSSTSIARAEGVLSEEAAVTIISQDGGLPMPVYWSTDALITCCMVWMIDLVTSLFLPLFETLLNTIQLVL